MKVNNYDELIDVWLIVKSKIQNVGFDPKATEIILHQSCENKIAVKLRYGDEYYGFIIITGEVKNGKRESKTYLELLKAAHKEEQNV